MNQTRKGVIIWKFLSLVFQKSVPAVSMAMTELPKSCYRILLKNGILKPAPLSQLVSPKLKPAAISKTLLEIRHHIKNSSHFPMVNLDHHRSSPIENLDSGAFLGLLLVLWMFQKETPKPLIKSIVNDPCEDSQLSIGSQLRNGYFAEVSLRYSIEFD